MPQDVKAAGTPQQTSKENFEGWTPHIENEDQLRAALDRAFDYRGDITIALRGGQSLEGYVFDRRSGPTLNQSFVRLFPSDRDEKVSVCYSDITGLSFTGRDTAAGKSFETWIKKYFEKKAKGETASIESERLD